MAEIHRDGARSAAARPHGLHHWRVVTGKEVRACAIQRHPDPRRAFRPLNCAAILRDLLESEVFGHLKARHRQRLSAGRRAAVANGGTLLSTNLREMDLPLQTGCCASSRPRRSSPGGRYDPSRLRCASSALPTATRPRRCGRAVPRGSVPTVCMWCRSMRLARTRRDDIMEIAQASLAEFAAELRELHRL